MIKLVKANLSPHNSLPRPDKSIYDFLQNPMGIGAVTEFSYDVF